MVLGFTVAGLVVGAIVVTGIIGYFIDKSAAADHRENRTR
jgi:hypothetical protein